MATEKRVRVVEIQARVVGLESLQAADRAMRQSAQAAKATGDGFKQATASMSSGPGGGFNRAIQNTSYQLQDFIVQTQGGTDAMRAFSQQAPQMLVGFGAMGAAIGLAAAALPALITGLTGAGGSLEVSEAALTQFNKGLSDLDAWVERDPDRFAEVFNKLSESQRVLALTTMESRRQLALFDKEQAKRAFEKGIESLGVFTVSLTKIGRDLDSAYATQSITEKLGLTDEDGITVTRVIRGIVSGIHSYGEALEEFNKMGVVGNDRFVELRRNLTDLAKNFEETEVSQRALNDAIAAGTAAKGKDIVVQKTVAAANKKAAEEAASREREMARLAQSAIKRDEARIEAARKAAEAEAKRAADELARIKDAALGRELDEIANSFERMATADPMKQIVDSLNETGKRVRDLDALRDKLDELYFSGKLTADQFDQLSLKFGLVGDSVEKNAAKVDTMDQSLKNLASKGVGELVDIFLEADKSFSQFATNFLKQIAKMIVQQQVLNALKGTQLGGLFGFAKGGAFSSSTGLPFGVYDRPTYFNMPGSGPLQKFARGGVLGEAGPEAILPLSRDNSGKLGLKGGGANVSVNVNNYSANEVSVSETRGADGEISIDVEIKKSMTRAFGDGSMDRVMKSVFGLSRQAA